MYNTYISNVSYVCLFFFKSSCCFLFRRSKLKLHCSWALSFHVIKWIVRWLSYQHDCYYWLQKLLWSFFTQVSVYNTFLPISRQMQYSEINETNLKAYQFCITNRTKIQTIILRSPVSNGSRRYHNKLTVFFPCEKSLFLVTRTLATRAHMNAHAYLTGLSVTMRVPCVCFRLVARQFGPWKEADVGLAGFASSSRGLCKWNSVVGGQIRNCAGCLSLLSKWNDGGLGLGYVGIRRRTNFARPVYLFNFWSRNRGSGNWFKVLSSSSIRIVKLKIDMIVDHENQSRERSRQRLISSQYSSRVIYSTNNATTFIIQHLFLND